MVPSAGGAERLRSAFRRSFCFAISRSGFSCDLGTTNAKSAIRVVHPGTGPASIELSYRAPRPLEPPQEPLLLAVRSSATAAAPSGRVELDHRQVVPTPAATRVPPRHSSAASWRTQRRRNSGSSSAAGSRPSRLGLLVAEGALGPTATGSRHPAGRARHPPGPGSRGRKVEQRERSRVGRCSKLPFPLPRPRSVFPLPLLRTPSPPPRDQGSAEELAEDATDRGSSARGSGSGAEAVGALTLLRESARLRGPRDRRGRRAR